jgi:hypothetical protein
MPLQHLNDVRTGFLFGEYPTMYRVSDSEIEIRVIVFGEKLARRALVKAMDCLGKRERVDLSTTPPPELRL